MSGGCAGGLGHPPACACPSCLCQVGSRFPHPGRREEGDTATVKCVTRRQMSPPPSAAEGERRGERCAARRGGEGQCHPGKRLSRCGAGTPTLTAGPGGDTEGVATDGTELGSMGCSWEAATSFQTGVGEGSCVWGQSLQELCVSVPTEHTDGCALGDKDTATAAGEVGAPAGGKEESAPATGTQWG